MTQDPNLTPIANRLEWVEPTVHQLDVRETAFNPQVGKDGGTVHADCTRS